MKLIRHILETSVCLFIGMSEATLIDRAISPLFAKTSALVGHERPLGVWTNLGKPDPSRELEFDIKKVIPLFFDKPRDISDFLLKICNSAMTK